MDHQTHPIYAVAGKKIWPGLMRFLPCLMLLVFTCAVDGQSRWKTFRTISRPERCWVLFHPFVAGKCLNLTKQAQAASERIMRSDTLDGDPAGGQVDAFRHAYWMALVSSRTGWRKARSLGRAHERGNHIARRKGHLEDGLIPDKPASDMDLWNNDAGIDIGRTHKNAPSDSLRIYVISAIMEGKMRVLSKNAAGQWLDCNGQPLPPESYTGLWENDKCLVPSDQKHE
ncbi:MAG: hypothetical protein KDD36_13505 [Flavobacteriales bacterium]|nr:hypothetical protein [Flavobacteriales bacterium]